MGIMMKHINGDLNNHFFGLHIMKKTIYFLEIFRKAEKKYRSSCKRLASDGWKKDWRTLIATILSAQTRDEVTIPVAEALFKKYNGLDALSKARYPEVLKIVSKVNFKYTKAKNIIAAAKYLVDKHEGKVPDDIEELIKIPGVGRKTANLVLSEVHKQDSITVDTHVFAICNILGFTKSKTPTQSEMQLKEFVPKRYWSRINRLFVLWGKDVSRKTKNKLLQKLNEK
jgi:endonuclease-3